MSVYLARRLLMLIAVLLGVSILVFLILHLTPGNPALLIAGPDAPPETLQAIERELGLDQPIYMQYWRFLERALHGDLGKSLRSRLPVSFEVARAFPVTFQLTLVAILFSVVVSVPLGVTSAVNQNTWLDSLTMFSALLGISMPVFAVGLILMWVFGFYLGWLPISGFAPLTTLEGWRSIILPAVTVSSASIATMARLTRSSMLEVLRQDYVRTARAKGLGEKVVIYKHALRNALLPVVTVIGLQIGGLLGGAVVTESIFALPGMGRLSVKAVESRDFPLVQGLVLLIAIIFVLTNLLVDIFYALIDPRIRYE
ncbi:MAG: ABC transporter permease [Firmicutes bacterium]|nr:ABC transporter permease [Bacillota bacterium]